MEILPPFQILQNVHPICPMRSENKQRAFALFFCNIATRRRAKQSRKIKM